MNQSPRMLPKRRAGLTLLEMILVVGILAVLAGLVVPLLTGTSERAQEEATRASMIELREAIMGRADRPGFAADVGRLPDNLGELIVNPPVDWTDPMGPKKYAAFDRNTSRGWRGPYAYGTATQYPPASYYIANDPPPTSPYHRGYCDPNSPLGDQAFADAWYNSVFARLNPIVLLEPTSPDARLVSAGADGVLATNDDIVVFLRK